MQKSNMASIRKLNVDGVIYCKVISSENFRPTFLTFLEFLLKTENPVAIGHPV